MNKSLGCLLAVAMTFTLAGLACPRVADNPPPVETSSVASTQNAEAMEKPVERNTDSADGHSHQGALVAATNRFTFKLFELLRGQPGNLMASPYSVASVLELVLPGARGATREQIAAVLQTPGQESATLLRTRVALNQELAGRQEVKVPWFDPENPDPEYRQQAETAAMGFELRIHNGVWGQRSYPFVPAYLELVQGLEGTAVESLDFEADPGGARKTINRRIGEQTNGLIPELLPEGSIKKLTRLILTNAIYFKARWKDPFEERDTSTERFHLPGGKAVDVPTMHSTGFLSYQETPDLQAVELPYNGGDVAMLLVLPGPGRLEAVQQLMSPTTLSELGARPERRRIRLALPRFEFGSSYLLRDDLIAMGMSDPFNMGLADFTGITEAEKMAIDQIIHETRIKVDEYGTEAAAATAMAMLGAGAPPPDPLVLKMDRPFLFVIHDKQTGAVLFVGRVVDPRVS